MIHSECDVYTNSIFVSSKKSKKIGEGTGASKAKFPEFVKNINKFYEFHEQNESECARKFGIKPQLFNRWRTGENAPTKLSRPEIARILGLTVDELMYGSARIGEAAGKWMRSPHKEVQRLIDDVQKLIDTSDEKLINHLREQIALLLDLAARRQGDRRNAVAALDPPTVNVNDYELKSDDQ